jgi:hypothetical protein
MVSVVIITMTLVIIVVRKEMGKDLVSLVISKDKLTIKEIMRGTIVAQDLGQDHVIEAIDKDRIPVIARDTEMETLIN